MKKNSLPIRSLTAALSVKRSLPAILAAGLLMGSFAQRAQAQATPAQSEETTHNLLDRVVLIKASAAGKVKFTLAPEDPTKVTRDHWPIVFIDYENDGKNIRQMYNLTEDREFEVNVAATQGGVIKITGENGMWKLVSASQTLKDATFNTAPALRYVDLHDNVLGTANAQGRYALGTESDQIETLNLATNKLKDFDPGGSTASTLELNLSENLLTSFYHSDYSKVQILDLSKNLLDNYVLISGYDCFKSDNWSVYKGGNAAAFQKALGGDNADIKVDRRLAVDGMANLSINKLNIATLPALPGKLPKEHYYYTLQQRYEVPKSPRNDDTWRPLETMDLSRQLKATGVAGSEKTTRYEVWREINAATDQYVRVPATDYQISEGRITFRRGYGENARLFVAMTTDAFNTDGYPLESFERGTATAVPISPP